MEVNLDAYMGNVLPAIDLANPSMAAGALTVDVDPDIAARLNFALSKGMYDYAAFLMTLQLQRNTSGTKTQLGVVNQSIGDLRQDALEKFQALNTATVNINGAIKDATSGVLQLAGELAGTKDELNGLRGELAIVKRLVKRSAFKPKIQYVTITGAKDMGVKILFEAVWSPITDPQNDTATRELTVSIENGGSTTLPFKREDVKAEGLEAPVDTNVTLSLVDIDASGNRSEADTYSFIAADTVAPPSPTGLGVNVTGQRVDPD